MLKMTNKTNLKATLCSSSTTSKEEDIAETLVLANCIIKLSECREND